MSSRFLAKCLASRNLSIAASISADEYLLSIFPAIPSRSNIEIYPEVSLWFLFFLSDIAHATLFVVNGHYTNKKVSKTGHYLNQKKKDREIHDPRFRFLDSVLQEQQIDAPLAMIMFIALNNIFIKSEGIDYCH